MLGRLATWPIRYVVRRACKWKLLELRRYERILVAQARTSEKMSGDRLDALGAMLKQLREEIAMLERQYVRAA